MVGAAGLAVAAGAAAGGAARWPRAVAPPCAPPARWRRARANATSSAGSAGPAAARAEQRPRPSWCFGRSQFIARRRAGVGAATPSALADHPRRRDGRPRSPLLRSRRRRRQSQSRPRRLKVIFRRAQLRYSQTRSRSRPTRPRRRPGTSVSAAPACRPITGGLQPSGAWARAGRYRALVWRTGQSLVTPYVIEVDKAGEVRAVGEATTPYRPTDAQIAFHLAHFISNVRSLAIDPVIVRQSWLDAYQYTTDRGAATLNDYARANDPSRASASCPSRSRSPAWCAPATTRSRCAGSSAATATARSAATERWTAILSSSSNARAPKSEFAKTPWASMSTA